MILSDLSPGQVATIRQINAQDLPQPIKRKLLSMGLTPNSSVEFVRNAPLGSNLQVKIRGSQLCLRKDLAEKIQVEVSQ
ncbi:FeoA family protein [Paraferrimonas sedimenticola]|uniref:Iron transporter FeoA n=1 Tax=Paraferrimonas sedimenticola TaxID=375674 RepID=A0AA37VSP1_9GAMM|nr:FeoA family protein [Paraferrimonas sedimenticola]GLP94796.1 iron transporter FeoA [Paraferrimonas sedimenticola]